MAENTAPDNKVEGRKRPLSPHLQIYKWQYTMLTSILHRASGIILAAGLILFILAFVAIFHGEFVFVFLKSILQTPYGKLFLFLWVWAFSYHFCNGIRHLLWDIGIGFSLTTSRRSAYYVFLGSLLMTLYVFSLGYGLI